MICPRCKQGDVIEARVRSTDALLFVCEECEATWFNRDAIGQGAFVDFGTYMEGVGLLPLWDELILSIQK